MLLTQEEQDEHDEVIVRSMMHAVMSSRYALTYAADVWRIVRSLTDAVSIRHALTYADVCC